MLINGSLDGLKVNTKPQTNANNMKTKTDKLGVVKALRDEITKNRALIANLRVQERHAMVTKDDLRKDLGRERRSRDWEVDQLKSDQETELEVALGHLKFSAFVNVALMACIVLYLIHK